MIPTKFGKCLILMWPFGETSEAAMRALVAGIRSFEAALEWQLGADGVLAV